MTINRRTLALFCISLGIAGCDWSALWGLDAPRPGLGDGDSFQVDPDPVDLIIDPSGIASVPRLVTLTGRRKDKLGAQSVPVVVRRGPCGEAADAGESATDAGDMPADGGNAASGYSGTELANAYTNSVELVALPDLGCQQRSPSLLDCTLDARGEAAFNVVGDFPDDEVTLGGYVPICVTPYVIGTAHGQATRFQRTVHVVPRFGASKIALAVSQLPGGETSPDVPEDAKCDSLYACDPARARATFQAGVVGTDIPAGDVRPGDYLPVRHDIELRLRLQPLSTTAGDSAFLSSSSLCMPPDAASDSHDGGPALSVSIESNQKTTESFFLCASRFEASYQITASLVAAKPEDPATQVDSESDADAPTTRETVVVLSPLAEGYLAVPFALGSIVTMKLCGGMQVHTPPTSVQITGAQVVENNDTIVLTCASPDPDEDAGRVSLDASTASAPVADCHDVTLAPATGGTCSLDLSSSAP